MLNLDDNSARHAALSAEVVLGEEPRFADDFALVSRAGEADPKAQEQLADRLVARVLRGASALLSGSQDAEDAALHALIELLRSHRRFRVYDSIESWADRVMSGSIVRYGRAVQRISQPPELDFADAPRARSRKPAPLRDALEALAAPARETLLLRHTFGHALESIAALTQVSTETARDRLISARRELRRREASLLSEVTDTAVLAGVERWEVLSDHDAAGDLLSPEEIEELEALGQAHAQVLEPWVALSFGLATLLDEPLGRESQRLEHELVARALASLQVTSPGRRARLIDYDGELARVADPEGPRWVPYFASAMSVLMVLGTGLALFHYEPRSLMGSVAEAASGEAMAGALLVPQVEQLFHVHAAERGARVRRGGVSVAPGAPLSQGDELSAGEKPACFMVDARLELCLAANSSVKLDDLSTAGLRLSLTRGRMTAHLVRGASPLGYRVKAGDVEIVGQQAATLGIERNDDANSVRVRLLRGAVAVEAGSEHLELSEPKVAWYRGQEGTLEASDLLPGVAQREWDVVAAGRFGASIAPSYPSASAAAKPGAEKDEAKEATADASADTTAAAPPAPKSARELMQEAWELLKAERWADAARVYETIARELPESEEAHIVKVRLGGLFLERLGDPGRALIAFERYLREGGGALAAEARYGRIAVFRRVGQPEHEVRAIREFLRLHPESPHVTALNARLRVLDPRAP